MEARNTIRKRYYFVTGILFLLALGLLLLPHRKNVKELSPEDLLVSISTSDRFYSPENVARLIISGDPSIQLIDVRTAEEFAAYSLPKAINIPLANILDKDKKGNYVWQDVLNQDIKTNIIYSNGTVYANQAWMLISRMNFKNNYVLKGGLNAFFENIIKAKAPLASAPQSEIDLYSFRKAVAMYFGGGGSISTATTDAKSGDGTPVVKKKKEAKSGGGC